MKLRVRFITEAEAEFKKLDKAVRTFFISKLEERCENARVPKDALGAELAGYYKIKSNSTGHRLIYKVEADFLIVIAIGKRADMSVYRISKKRR